MTSFRVGHTAAVLLALAGVALTMACGDTTSPGSPDVPDDTTRTDTMAMNSSLALTDADILTLSQFDSTWTWWEFSDSLLDRMGNSPHGDRIRVRYNPAAATQLDSTGRLVANPDFPDSSAVVKEVYSGGSLYGILVMYKAIDDPHAGHGSWLWLEYGDGAVVHSVAQDNGYCHNCHVQGVDHMRMPDSH